MLTLKKTLSSALCITALLSFPLFSQQYFDNWKVTPNPGGNTVSMVCTNPSTPLGVEQELAYETDNAGTPLKATVKFKGGRERALTPEETAFYWSLLRGSNSYWNFLQPQARINSFTSSTDMIPFSYLGRVVRVISNDGVNYMGTLSQNTNIPEWFSLDIKGNRVLFYRKAVREIQEIK
jgi:hypothetical protein